MQARRLVAAQALMGRCCTNGQQLLPIHNRIQVAPPVRVAGRVAYHHPLHPPSAMGHPTSLLWCALRLPWFLLHGTQVDWVACTCRKVHPTSLRCPALRLSREPFQDIQVDQTSTPIGSASLILEGKLHRSGCLSTPVPQQVQAVHPPHVVVARHRKHPQLTPVHRRIVAC